MAKYNKEEKVERLNLFSSTSLKDHKTLSGFENNGELMALVWEWRDLRLKFQETGSKFIEEKAQALKQSILYQFDITVYDLVRLAKMG